MAEVSKRKLLVVSNRLPVSVSRVGGELVFTESSGGLATAMSSLDEQTTERIWVGWPGIELEELKPGEKKQIIARLSEMGCHPVFLNKEQVKNFYSGYANDTIWPLFHYFQSYTQHNSDYWSAYKQVNDLYAHEVLRIVDKETDIWVHDYHLMLLPKLLRDKESDLSIGFFLHVPFPSYEVFRQLANGEQLLEGMLGADLIGFHIYDYVRHFLSSVLRTTGRDSKDGVLNINGRTVKADAFPIGIDFDKFSNASKTKISKKYFKELKKLYKDQRVILSVDRLDYSKGIPKRLEAFEQLLGSNKSLHKKIVLIILAVPSRSDVNTYQELRDSIELSVSRINGIYSTVDWTPINYQYKNTPFEELSAIYRLADIALVTPLRDGMNLVAKEYVAANKDSTGVLILSEMAGAADELLEAIKINPNNTDSIEKAILQSLAMPKKEQKTRLKAMNAIISKYTVQKWGQDFVSELSEVKRLQQNKAKTRVNKHTLDEIREEFIKAKQRTIFLDYDGTLVRLQPDHKANIKPSRKLSATLARLANSKDTQVCIISGRNYKTLQKWLGSIRSLSLIAEHGAWIKTNGKWTKAAASIKDEEKAILSAMDHITKRTPGSEVEQKTTSLVWHYRKVPSELAYVRKMNLLRELHNVISGNNLSIHQGSKIIEVKPKSINKGNVVGTILKDNPADFILCIGDDYTDEDMFKTLPGSAYTVKVGHEPTVARLWVDNVDDVAEILESLVNRKPSVLRSIKPRVKKGLSRGAHK